MLKTKVQALIELTPAVYNADNIEILNKKNWKEFRPLKKHIGRKKNIAITLIQIGIKIKCCTGQYCDQKHHYC